MRACSTALMVWLAIGTTSVARDIFVNNLTGDDRTDGWRPTTIDNRGGPVQTIAKALRLAGPGDRVVVANTEVAYRESLSLSGERLSGGVAGPLVIEGNGATLDGSGLIRDDAWTHYQGDVHNFTPARLGYQQLFLGNAGALALRHPVARSSPRPAALEPLEWCLWDGRIFFRTEPRQMPQDYGLACCQLQSGITLYHVHDVVVSNLIVQGFHVDGVNVLDGVRDSELRGITARANGRSGISAGGSSRALLVDCVMTDNGATQLRTEECAHVHLVNTRLVDSTAPALQNDGGRVTTGSEYGTP